MALPTDPAALANLLNAAYAEARALPRVVPQPQEIPDFTPNWILAQREQAWFGKGLITHEADGELVSLVDVRVEGEEAQIGCFATHPDHRRHGYASHCLRQALVHARGLGARRARAGHVISGLIDSRIASACAFLEHHGFAVRDLSHQNMVLQIDTDGYEPQPVELPEGYELRTLDLNRLDEWLAVRNAVFGPVPEAWLLNTFVSRWDFDPAGWQIVYCGNEPVGIAGADFHRDPAHPETISGCQIEYVGVREEHRGKRLGELLMYACLNHAQRHQVRPCQLITQRFRTAAVTLYEKLGFRFMRDNHIYEKSLAEVPNR